MKGLVFKIISVIGTLAAIFIAGSRSGKSKEQNKQLKREQDDSIETIKINKGISNMDFTDKSNFLLSKQKRKGTK
jgi:hypothetical protein